MRRVFFMATLVLVGCNFSISPAEPVPKPGPVPVDDHRELSWLLAADAPRCAGNRWRPPAVKAGAQ